MALALPILLTRIVQRSISFTNTLLLATYSTDALAASALALSPYFNAQLFGTGISAAVSVLVAQSLGKGDHPRDIQLSVRMGLWAAFGIGVLLAAGLFFTEQFLALISQPPELVGPAGEYARIFSISLPFSIGYGVLAQFAIAVGRPLVPVIVIGITALFNLAASYGLIFGAVGLPELGLRGAALAGCLSNVLSFLLLVLLIAKYRPLRQYHVFAQFLRFDVKWLKEIVVVGLPISLTMMLEVVFFTTSTLMMGYLGTTALAAYQIVMVFTATTFLIPISIATAATVRVAMAVGASSRDGVQNAGTAAILLSVVIMGAGAVLMVVFRDPIIGIFVAQDTVEAANIVALGAIFLLFAAAYQIFDAVQATANFVLRGMKDTVVPMWINASSYWLVGFPIALALTFWLGFGPIGVWIAYVLALFCASTLMLFRFLRLAWGNAGEAGALLPSS